DDGLSRLDPFGTLGAGDVGAGAAGAVEDQPAGRGARPDPHASPPGGRRDTGPGAPPSAVPPVGGPDAVAERARRVVVLDRRMPGAAAPVEDRVVERARLQPGDRDEAVRAVPVRVRKLLIR